jgi:hypothetical protein
MGIVPSSRLGKIEFYENHIEPWSSNAALIGITELAVGELDSATSAARAAYNAHLAAQQAAKVATQNFYEKVRLMHNAPGRGADLIAAIKNYAQSTNNPDVYTLAQIPPPSGPGKVPPPALPTDFRVEIGQSGNLILRWKANNPAGSNGTVYLVERRLNNSGPFAFIGAAGGDKTFDDTTLPSGVSQIEYRVRGQRSGISGPAAIWTVRVGGGGGSFVITEQFPGTDEGESGVKMAA